jgi:FkbM family methyltransferase
MTGGSDQPAPQRTPQGEPRGEPQGELRGGLRTASALKIRVSKLVANDVAGRLIGALTGNRVRHQGLRFDVRSDDFSPRVRAQMFWGAYEGAETRMIRSFLTGASTVVELGSSLGVTTAHIAAVMAPGGHLVCVEANPRLIPGLRDRISPCASSLRIDLIHAAVTSHCGTTLLTVASETVGSRLGRPRPHEATVRVPAVTLREILARTGVADFDLVSDIEGAEVAFLLQDAGVLERCRRGVVELHETTVAGAKVSVFDLIDAVRAAGFQIVSRHGPVVAFARGAPVPQTSVRQTSVPQTSVPQTPVP